MSDSWVAFSQPYKTAIGIIKGHLNAHIEFLMGTVEVEGDILALSSYRGVLAIVQESIASVSSSTEFRDLN